MYSFSVFRKVGYSLETFDIRQSLAQSIMDNNLLEGVRRWLEPLPDKSLPALNIQNFFYEQLNRMDIDTNCLKESGLGRVVLFYTKCKRVTPTISRQANELIAAWSRPIIKRSASYRDRQLPTMSLADGEQVHRQNERLNQILARARESEKNKVRKNAVTIPTRMAPNYTVAPRPDAGFAKLNTSVDNDIERRKRNAERLRLLTRKVGGK